jgi:hypothetical protein
VVFGVEGFGAEDGLGGGGWDGVLLGFPGRCTASTAAAATARTGRAAQPLAPAPTARPSTVAVRQTRCSPEALALAEESLVIVLPASEPESGTG